MTNPICPHCPSTSLKKNGRDRHNRQRWMCNSCGKTHSEGADTSNKGGRPQSTEIDKTMAEFGISRDAAKKRLSRAKRKS